MKKILLSAVSLAALSGAAIAADLPTHKAPPPVMSTVSPWQGVYAGINAGYGVNNITVYNTGMLAAPTSNYSQALAFNNAQYIAGGVAGAQLGYNYVFANHVVAGAEIDFDWADIYNNANPQQGGGFLLTSTNNTQNSLINSNYGRLGLDWIGTVRGRLGYDMGKFLPYITGGFAYGGLSNTVNLNSLAVMGANTGGFFTNGSSSTVGIGWAAGAGAEYMVTDNWSLKGEYLFTSIGGISTPASTVGSYTGTAPYGISSAGASNQSTGSFGVHQVRAGLNYHANWFSAPVVAKF